MHRHFLYLLVLLPRSLFAFDTFLVSTLWQFPKRTSGGLFPAAGLDDSAGGEGTEYERVMEERTGWVWNGGVLSSIVCIRHSVSYQYNSTLKPKK